MSDTPQRFTRRSVAVGGGIAVALGLGALGVTLPRWLGHQRTTPYDDLLAQLVDRDAAVKIGHAYLASGATIDSKALARDLRQRLERRTLTEVTNSDLAQGKLTEVQGWVLPETLVLLCALVAQGT